MIDPKKPGVVLSNEQIAERKKKAEEQRREKELDYKIKKEKLMKECGVVEVAIIKFDPMTGITPSSVVLPYEWKEEETLIRDNDAKKDGNKTKKTK